MEKSLCRTFVAVERAFVIRESPFMGIFADCTKAFQQPPIFPIKFSPLFSTGSGKPEFSLPYKDNFYFSKFSPNYFHRFSHTLWKTFSAEAEENVISPVSKRHATTFQGQICDIGGFKFCHPDKFVCFLPISGSIIRHFRQKI